MSVAPKQPQYPYVEHDDQGIPFIAGTTMKIVELVVAQRAHGWSPEELSFQFPQLTMAQIHSALAYYWDNQQQLDEDIERRTEAAEALRSAARHSPLARRLAAEKRH
jgi:uncharacterized protein (DUF433 family)